MDKTEVQLEFEFGCPNIEAEYYREGAQAIIQRLVPPDLLTPSRDALVQQRIRFSDQLPIIEWSELQKGPCCLSALLLCRYRHNASQFFFEMISRWLLPHKRLNVELFFASDVRLPHLSDDLLSVAEVVIYLKGIQEVEEVRRNLSALEAEIRLGIISHYHARRILEFKGLSSDGKTAMIQEKISSLIQNRSKDFDRDMLAQMQQFLVNCPEELKSGRDYHHLSRMISNLYSIRKVVMQNSAVAPSKRHVVVKFLKTRVQIGSESRSVLGVLVGLNFLSEHEVFSQEHLVKAIQQQIPELRFVPDSYFSEPGQNKLLQTIYLEMEKVNRSECSLDEIQELRTTLPHQLKSRIEQLSHPLFMPRNEEEVLRNIMSLAQELRSVHDIPQVTLSFDGQTIDEVCFTVILLRIRTEESAPIEELSASTASGVRFVLERVRKLSLFRKKYYKEAAVFRASVPLRAFLRADHSVDLYQARHRLLSELVRLFGDVRDYNGGMIHRQNELLNLLKSHFPESHHLLLEQFFFALQPVEMRAILDEGPLRQWFSLLLQAAKGDRRKPLLCKQEGTRLFAILTDLAEEQRVAILDAIRKLGLPRHQLVSFAMEAWDSCCLGFLFFAEDPAEQQRFLDILSVDAAV